MARQKQLQDLLFVDVETTGLDPTKHELLEVAARRTSPDGQTILGEYTAKLRPLNLAAAEPKALEVNKYSEEEWAPEKCVARDVVVKELHRIAQNCVLVGHNVSFDEGFLRALFYQANLQPPWGYHKVDTVALAWPLYVTKPDLEGVSLVKLAKYLELPTQPVHRAAADVAACHALYMHLMKKWNS